MFDSPASARYWIVEGRVLFALLYLLGTACFVWIVAKRMTPLLRAQRDPRFDHPWARMGRVAQYWLGQWRHPRYPFAGALHIVIFAGFLILALRAFGLLIIGVSASFVIPDAAAYRVVREYAATLVFLAMVVAIFRRLWFRPARYPRSGDAIFLLALIAVLMAADGVFEGANAAAHQEFLYPGTLGWAARGMLPPASLPRLSQFYLGAYLLHGVTFFFLLCYRPFGIQFHVETSLFSIYFSKLDRGTLKPVRWSVADQDLDQLKSFGVKTFEDFTWKHILDFYSCADCGRCAEQCPANTVGRPLAPRAISIKARDYCFQHYPVFRSGRSASDGQPPLVGTIFSADEVWSCTTCGACEAECPLLVEYIDKIVDLRRGLVDDGNVPQSLAKPLKALESRGNPYGKTEKKRAEWANGNAPILNGNGSRAETLYFVDSITSYDDRIQMIGRATVRLLTRANISFGILGPAERDSGHEVRRFGEETLFRALRDHNAAAIQSSGVERIVTSDPHAFNALKHDYRDIPPVEHTAQVIARHVRTGALRFQKVPDPEAVYTYHDPCYLGRHNGVFEDPREVLDAIPGLKRVEMGRCRDRSFCCGGGGLALFYEPHEAERMGVKRVRMAAEAGANVIVTACPFCMVNIEDAIKVAGMEGKMTAIDLTELAEAQLAGT